MRLAQSTRLVWFFALVLTPLCGAQQGQGRPLQVQNQPLQITIRQTSAKPLFRVDLHNAGRQALALNLGVFGDPTFVLLSIKDEQGKVLTMQFEGDRGGVEDSPSVMNVSLAPGATYSIPVDLDRWVPMPFMPWARWMSALGSGRHTIQATYRYVRASGGADSFWEGSVVSNTIPFTAPQ
jgi:hypothetical protein